MFNKQTTANTQHNDFNGHRGCGGFGGKFNRMFGENQAGRNQWREAFDRNFGNRKAANIEETDSAFMISLYAAGLQKNDFSVSVVGDMLTIRYTAPAGTENGENQYAHLEYQPASFERSFQLNGKAMIDGISATYIDGVLKVTLPKNPETNKPAQQVKVD